MSGEQRLPPYVVSVTLGDQFLCLLLMVVVLVLFQLIDLELDVGKRGLPAVSWMLG